MAKTEEMPTIKKTVKEICEGENKCKHTKTLDVIHSAIKTNRDYWLFTELFCLLHDNKDFCNCD